MRIYFLDQRESRPPLNEKWRWDLVVDLGRSSDLTYESHSREFGCPVISLYQFAEEVSDLYLSRQLIEAGVGKLMDSEGLDWWSLLSPDLVPGLLQLIMVHRLAAHLSTECEMFSRQPDYRIAALHRLLGGKLVNTDRPLARTSRRVRRFSSIASSLKFSQLFQIAQDKFDTNHTFRRKLHAREKRETKSWILLPSAYSNVSRAAIRYAQLLPDEQFLLMCTRNEAKIRDLPGNLTMESLDGYFVSSNTSEVSNTLERWAGLKNDLMAHAPELFSAGAFGVLDRMPSLIRWGISIRDAWQQLFLYHEVRACVCADHSNPYTKIPLLLTKRAGLPALASHHGALDAFMAVTSHDADFYLAKTDMERDYMSAVCRIDSTKVFSLEPHAVAKTPEGSDKNAKPWLVFFSEPYEAWSLRKDEVYRHLLPQLVSLARDCGLKLVFKLHPFETAKGHRKLLSRFLPADTASQIEVISGPPTSQLWENCRFAITAQSSVAVEATSRGIPIFLCGWLRDLSSGYVQQYEKFGMGKILWTSAQIEEIPRLLMEGDSPSKNTIDTSQNARETFKNLLDYRRARAALPA
jgi:hypothetical protein